MLTHSGDENYIYSVVKLKKRKKIDIGYGAKYYNRENNDHIKAHGKISFRSILSLRSNSDNTHRVVLKDPKDDRLKIILNAKLTGKVTAEGMERFDFSIGKFVSDTDGELFHKGGIDISQIKEYVRGMGEPYDVKW